MRWLGADPAQPADDVEGILMIHLNNRVVARTNRMAEHG